MTRGRLLVVGGVLSLVLLSAATVTALIASGSDVPSGSTWVRVATLDQLDERGVVYSSTARAFVIETGGVPTALLARSPQMGEPVRYCETSGWFQDRAHGSMFDSQGRYVLGPAPRGLDHLEVHIVANEIWVDPTQIHLGSPRGVRDVRPAGPFCWRADGHP